MKKMIVDELYGSLGSILSEKEGYSIVFRMSDRVAKFFDYRYLESLLSNGYDIEKKILSSSPISDVSEVIVPTEAIYDSKGNFAGYTMPYVSGISFDRYMKLLKSSKSTDSFDLFLYARLFDDLEKIIAKSENVVFPNLLGDDNIFFDSSFHFIDYDCIQINGFPSHRLSGPLGDISKYLNTKYMNGAFFNKNLDIKSLIYLYFITVFDFDLSLIEFDNIKNALNDLGFYDDILIDKVLRLYDDFVPNLYLGSSLYDIAYDYKIYIDSDEKKYVKKA